MMGLRRRPNPEVYEDPNYDWRKHDPKLADDLEEQIFEKTNYATVTHAPDAAERDSLEHKQRVFLQGLTEALSAQLKGQDIRCTRAIPDGYGEGYLVTCRDKQGREYSAHLSFDEGIKFGQERGETMGREIVDLLCTKILDARNRWFLRMQ